MIEFNTGDLEITYYLSGPMSGLPEFNYPAFERAATRLRTFGVKIVSPHEIEPPSQDMVADDLWRWYMERCFEQMELCQAIIMLRGWPESGGAFWELQHAIEKKFPVFLYLETPGRLIRMSGETNGHQEA